MLLVIAFWIVIITLIAVVIGFAEDVTDIKYRKGKGKY